MKIIQYGDLKPQFAQCQQCGALLEFTYADLNHTPRYFAKGPQHDGKDLYIKCAVCGHKILDGYFADSVSRTLEEHVTLECEYLNRNMVSL